ncbi:MAG: hypothetical protein RL154_1608 [Pseudomonadota bacterium]|jgi:HlyD family secretion protein
MNKKYIYIGALLVAGLAIFFGYKYYTNSVAEKERFKLAKVEIKNITQTVSANGTINPVSMISIGTQVSGTVQKLFVDYNSYVKEGQILAELDPVLFKAQLAQSKAEVSSAIASVDLANANLKRADELFSKGYISRQEYDQAVQTQRASKASLDLSRAKENKDQSNLNFSVIRSPVAGIVVDRQVDIGQTVAASFQTPTLFKIAKDLSKMQIDTNFAEADIGTIGVGQKAIFSVDAYPGKSFEGNVTQIRLSPTVTQNVVTYDVVISVNNPQELLKPGMTAFVSVITSEAKNVASVPNAALRFKPAGFERDIKKGPPQKQGTSLYVLKNNIPEQLKVKTGVSDGKFTQIITDELKADDEVIVSETVLKDSSSSKSPPRMF